MLKAWLSIIQQVRRSLLCITVAVGALSLSVRLGAAAELEWPKPARRLEVVGRKWHLLDSLATAAIGAGYLYVELGRDLKPQPLWRGGVLFDDAASEVLAGGNRAKRNFAAGFSDGLNYVSTGLLVVDTLVVPLLTDNWNIEVALHSSLITIQAQALLGMLGVAGRKFIARERPDVEKCRGDPNYDNLCFRGITASFPSGHTSVAFASAGLSCAHHLAMPLYGGGWPDVLACVTNMGLATTVGVLRVRSGRHYLTDVLAGATLGVSAGFLVPWYLYYRSSFSSTGVASRRDWTLVPLSSGQDMGVGMVGWF